MSELPAPDLIFNPRIQKGSILIYRVFDIAEEIDLSLVEQVITGESNRSRVSISRGGRNAVIMRNPPVRLSLGTVELRSIPLSAELSGTVWDYGVISLVYQILIPPGTDWNQLISTGAVLAGNPSGISEGIAEISSAKVLEPSHEVDQLSRQKIQELVRVLAPAMKQPNAWHTFEDYQIYFLEKMTHYGSIQDLVQFGRIPELLLAEPMDRLSLQNRSSILENLFQYSANDFVVLDWNSAVVLEPQGQRDIVDVIEFTLTHLLEFRYYDDLLDQRLNTLYNAIESHKAGRGLRIWENHFSRLSRETSIRYIEISEFLERVENSLKVVGDFYVAVIYRNTIQRFRIPDWQNSITRKMNLLARVSQLLQSHVEVQRGHSLEFIIILLIAFEIVQALIRGV